MVEKLKGERKSILNWSITVRWQQQLQLKGGALWGIKSVTQWVRYTPQFHGLYIFAPLAGIFEHFAEPWNLLDTVKFGEYGGND
jgi:hypothetical protein